MRITNFYSRPFLKTLFVVFLGLGVLNIAIAFTNLALFSMPLHLAFGALFIVLSLLLLTREFFVEYDSRNDLIEIERSRLFSSPRKPRVNHMIGYVKYRVRDYEIKDRWYGSRLIIKYEKLNGEIITNEIPFSFLSNRHIRILKRDLSRIVSSDTTLFIGSSFRNPSMG